MNAPKLEVLPGGTAFVATIEPGTALVNGALADKVVSLWMESLDRRHEQTGEHERLSPAFIGLKLDAVLRYMHKKGGAPYAGPKFLRNRLGLGPDQMKRALRWLREQGVTQQDAEDPEKRVWTIDVPMSKADMGRFIAVPSCALITLPRKDFAFLTYLHSLLERDMREDPSRDQRKSVLPAAGVVGIDPDHPHPAFRKIFGARSLRGVFQRLQKQGFLVRDFHANTFLCPDRAVAKVEGEQPGLLLRTKLFEPPVRRG